MRGILAALLLLGLAGWARATIVNVPADQPTIQAGIDSAATGDTVLVAPGAWYENVRYRGKGIVVASRFLFTRNPADVDSTVIDGSRPTAPDTASCVVIAGDSLSHSNDSAAALIGFTLTGGSGTRWRDEHGAGVFREGGGILIQYASPLIRFNRITRNRAVDGRYEAGGGAIRVGDGNPRIRNNMIDGNYSSTYGGGIVLNYTGADVRNNVVTADTTGSGYGAGGGIWIYAADPLGRLRRIENNTIVANWTGPATALTGGIYVQNATAGIRNNIIRGNRNVQINGVARIDWCDIQGGFNGTGNIDVEPQYLDYHHYYLTDSSPGVDAGDTAASDNDPEDQLNPGRAIWPARGGLRNDMGAYGGPGSSDLPAAIFEVPPPVRTSRLELSVTGGRPLTIRYSLSEPSPVRLTICDISGRTRQVLVSAVQSAGVYTATWNGATPGIYFTRLQTRAGTVSRKTVLLN